jgi:hypothetical protein
MPAVGLSGAERVLVGAWANFSALVRELAEARAEPVLLCAGRDRHFALEDAVCAGQLAEAVMKALPDDTWEMNDGARAAMALAREFPDPSALFPQTAAGRQIVEAGLAADLKLCARRDRHRIVPVLQDRQLTLSSLPLDAEELVRAGADAPWRGVPAGTVIGHVHLYVGDIDRAAGFYHDQVGFDKVVWSYPGALFMSAGGYHHHLGTNIWAAKAPPASDNDARLIEWEIIVPGRDDVDQVEASVKRGGAPSEREGDSVLLRDPWGTAVRVRPGP